MPAFNKYKKSKAAERGQFINNVTPSMNKARFELQL